MRVFAGFGAVLAILVLSGVAGEFLLGRIASNAEAYRSALAERSDAVDMDLVATKIRVRVNQWLRSMNPAFAQQADALLSDETALVTAVGSRQTGEGAAIVEKVKTALVAYTESWHVIQRLYAEEEALYANTLTPAANGIRTDLAGLRDAENAGGRSEASHLASLALDEFDGAERQAVRYRTTLKPNDAESLHQAIARSVGAITAFQAKVADQQDSARRIASRIGEWQASFDKAGAVAATRVARLTSWTNDESEVMAQGANALRALGNDRASATNAKLMATLSNSRKAQAGATLAAVLVGSVISVLLATSITRPLARMTAALKALAAGNHAIDVPETDRRDELGEMAKAAEVFKTNALQMQQMSTEQEATRVQGAADQHRWRARLADEFEAKVGSMINLLAAGSGELKTTAESLAGVADTSTNQARTVATSAEAACGGVQTVAAAAEELTASIREISRQVAESSRMADQAVEEAGRTDGFVRNLRLAAEKIGDVVGLITNIASQTNLLALNATIEAARAGDAGKGFAVVASEVKSLATQTGRATQEIGAQITQIQDATRQAVEAIQGITGTIGTISATTTSIAAAVEQQGAATAEIARSVQETAQSTDVVTKNIAGVSQAANDTGMAASQVLNVATNVSEQANLLSGEVGTFLTNVRAA